MCKSNGSSLSPSQMTKILTQPPFGEISFPPLVSISFFQLELVLNQERVGFPLQVRDELLPPVKEFKYLGALYRYI